MNLFAVTLFHHDPHNGRLILHAMPVMVVVLCCLVIAYRYYSAFLAAKVAVLDDSRLTPAHRFNDGQNYHPTNKWVLFGHHFAAISGAGPLIGPVLAIQYGFAPGLVWLVIGVTLAGAVQDMLVLAASVRRDGKSLAEIARHELGFPAAIIASVAILFIVVIALAGLGFVVVKALGGEEIKLPKGMLVHLPEDGVATPLEVNPHSENDFVHFPAGCCIQYAADQSPITRPEPFQVKIATKREEVKLPKGMMISLPPSSVITDLQPVEGTENYIVSFPAGCRVKPTVDQPLITQSEPFQVKIPGKDVCDTIFQYSIVWGATKPEEQFRRDQRMHEQGILGPRTFTLPDGSTQIVPICISGTYTLPADCTQVIPGSSWGTFTIATTIPIALLVGLWMYRIRPGRVIEASLIGGFLTLGAVVVGEPVSRSTLGAYFSLSRDQTIVALAVYGFIAAVLPVWLLLGPRDYLSSFLKVGTVGLLVISVCLANPPLHAPPVNEVFLNGGPTFPGQIFPFVFICIMCGAISGFHSLVSSGTTPKMIDRESHIRTIGYGSMLIEGLVGVTALIAAASLPPDLYYDINVAIDAAPRFQSQLIEVEAKYGVKPTLPREAGDRLHAAHVDSPQHLDLGAIEEKVGGESLRGRTGGAVTLAVGMSVIFEQAFRWFGVTGDWLLKYWYHFAIMFEALFILTTIDAGTRIARFLLQETAGRVYAPLARPDWLPGAVLASAAVTAGWAVLVWTGSIDTIWPMFGIANQILAVLALALVTTWLVNNGRGRYAPVTLVPLLFVTTTTLTAAFKMVTGRFAQMISDGEEKTAAGAIEAGRKLLITGYLNSAMTIFVVSCVSVLLLWAVARWVAVWMGKTAPPQSGVDRP